jgi:transposase
MEQEILFATALCLASPWKVSSVSFSVEKKRLDINIDFARGGVFPCPVCGNEAKAYDSKEESWRHLNFFRYEAYLHARVPRVQCTNLGCGIKKTDVPWARSGAGFTLLFEAFVMTLVRQMPVKAAAVILGTHDTRLWRVIDHYVAVARESLDCSDAIRLGIDETFAKKGHDYITLFHDLDKKRLLFATPGKDNETVKAFVEDLTAHKGAAENITAACIDMSKAFIKGIKESLPNAEITFDPFHIIQHVNDALGQVRAEEAKLYPQLMKNSRYAYLKNPDNLTEKQEETLFKLSQYRLKTGRSYLIKLALQDVYRAPTREQAEADLKSWYNWAIRSQIVPIKTVAKMVKKHWNGILSWFDSKLSNGYLEAINGLIQSAKRRARGYRSTKNLINIAYLIAGKLEFNLPI